ncbi:hypothetical protein IAT38_007366 [Cryptococcus sp. DSM 104549]
MTAPSLISQCLSYRLTLHHPSTDPKSLRIDASVWRETDDHKWERVNCDEGTGASDFADWHYEGAKRFSKLDGPVLHWDAEGTGEDSKGVLPSSKYVDAVLDFTKRHEKSQATLKALEEQQLAATKSLPSDSAEYQQSLSSYQDLVNQRTILQSFHQGISSQLEGFWNRVGEAQIEAALPDVAAIGTVASHEDPAKASYVVQWKNGMESHMASQDKRSLARYQQSLVPFLQDDKNEAARLASEADSESRAKETYLSIKTETERL